MAPAFLVIGIGNTLRRDDGAGWVFAQALVDALHCAGADVALILQPQLTPEMAESVAEQRGTSVVFVDASVATERVALTAVPDDEAAAPASHQLAPATILAIARHLYGVQVAGWLVQIPIQDLNHGEGLSRYAASSLDHADAIAVELLAQTSPGRSNWAASSEYFQQPHQPCKQSKTSFSAIAGGHTPTAQCVGDEVFPLVATFAKRQKP